jgi:hypothetical protein
MKGQLYLEQLENFKIFFSIFFFLGWGYWWGSGMFQEMLNVQQKTRGVSHFSLAIYMY